MNENLHSVCLLKNCFKYNGKYAHWDSNLQLKYLETDNFFKRTPVVDKIQSSVTGNTMKQSADEKKESTFITRRRRTRI